MAYNTHIRILSCFPLNYVCGELRKESGADFYLPRVLCPCSTQAMNECLPHLVSDVAIISDIPHCYAASDSAGPVPFMSSTTLIPTFEEAALARKSTHALDGVSLMGGGRIHLETDGQAVELPTNLLNLLRDALASMAKGQSIRLISLEEEVTPQEAAALLKVSRPFAARLFDQGIIPSRRVGTHRRALASDVMSYREKEKAARLETLDELTAEAQRLGL